MSGYGLWARISGLPVVIWISICSSSSAANASWIFRYRYTQQLINEDNNVLCLLHRKGLLCALKGWLNRIHCVVDFAEFQQIFQDRGGQTGFSSSQR